MEKVFDRISQTIIWGSLRKRNLPKVDMSLLSLTCIRMFIHALERHWVSISAFQSQVSISAFQSQKESLRLTQS